MSADLTKEIRKLFLEKRYKYRMNIMTLEEKQIKYKALLHAMQTGVMYELENDPTSGTPKHLRVGINAAMVNHGALVKTINSERCFHGRRIL